LDQTIERTGFFKENHKSTRKNKTQVHKNCKDTLGKKWKFNHHECPASLKEESWNAIYFDIQTTENTLTVLEGKGE
jgi:hypothetical protein